MSLMSLTEFETQARALGFEEVLERRWEPNQLVDTHAHAFDARALVVQGEMWLTVGDETQHLFAGDRFELSANVLHKEHYGSEGAVYWVARRASRPV